MVRVWLVLLASALGVVCPGVVQAEDAGEPFGDLPLVDEVVCARPDDGRPFEEAPKGASAIETILGRHGRGLAIA